MFDHGEKKEISTLFFETLNTICPGVPEPARAPESVPSIRPSSHGGDIDGLVADLERLGDLRDRGILTEDEFTQAKSRLLGRSGSPD